MTTHADGIYQYGGMPVTGGVPPFVSRNSKTFFVDPVNGLDGNSGKSPKLAFQTLYKAHAACTSGNNDVVYLIGNGALAGAAVLTLALAQSVDSTVSAGTLVWSKNATHLIGVSSPSNNSRSKIATVYDRDGTTYTAATFGSGNFVTVSGNGCYFRNISAQTLFSTGSTTGICWTDTGNRNVYENCQFFGQMDTESAQATGSRSLKVGSAGSGENMFIRCQIGQDTVTRTVANANLELAGGTPRNTFYKCIFPIMGSGNGQFGVLVTGVAAIDRWNLFDQCEFINSIKSTSANLTAMVSMTSASPGGLLRFKQCGLVGATKWGDTNALANSYVDNVGGAATDGLSLNPS